MALQESERLEQSARKVAFGKLRPRTDIRRAMCDLAVNALRSRVLTLPHVASVTAAIAHGIDPASVERAARTPASHSLALEGLLDAVSLALRAIEVAACEYLKVGGRLSPAEVCEWECALDTLAGMQPTTLAARIAGLRETIHATESEEIDEGSYVLSLLASGTLLGLLEGEHARRAPPASAS